MEQVFEQWNTLPARGESGMVAVSNPIAARVGLDVLGDGGNAIDAAVAISLALGVVEPFHSGIGGGCFLNYYDAASGRVTAIDGRGVAPSAATEDMYVRDGQVQWDDTVIGHRSVIVPGHVAGLSLAHSRWGSRPLSVLAEPAARIAEEGFLVSPIMAFLCDNDITRRALASNGDASRIYASSGPSPVAGELIRNPELAATYRLIGRFGADAFYRGEIAGAIVSEMSRGGGLITAEDLAEYRPRELEPLRGRYRGYEVLTFPPPSSGGTLLLQALGMLEGYQLQGGDRPTPETVHLMAEAMKLAFADRNHFLGDPAFVDVPLPELISKEYLGSRRDNINPRRASVASTAGSPTTYRVGSQTTSLAVADRSGNLLAMTQTTGCNLASGVVVPGTGMMLNHTMSDFCPQLGVTTTLGWGVYTSRANTIAPGKTPASSQAPTLIFKNGKPILAIGAAGGSRIPTAVLQTMLNVIDFGMDVQGAISSPRIHDQGAGLEVERFWIEELRAPLEDLGHQVVQATGYKDAMESWAQGVAIVPGGYEGGADPRADGQALGCNQ